jgi:RNA polymerase sigma-70 factor (ECF subfamily)
LRLLRFRKDRREEFEQEALPHLDALYRTAHWMLADPSVAEDAVQETYMKAWRSFDSFETGTNARAWLFAILSNCIKDIRAKAHHERPVANSDAVLADRNARPLPVATITDAGLARALASVPEDRRQVIWMADVEGLTYLEVSKALGIPIGTVMSRLSRGRRQLKESLENPPAAEGGRQSTDRTA